MPHLGVWTPRCGRLLDLPSEAVVGEIAHLPTMGGLRHDQRGSTGKQSEQQPDHPASTGPNQGASGRTGQTGGLLTPLHPRPEQNRQLPAKISSVDQLSDVSLGCRQRTPACDGYGHRCRDSAHGSSTRPAGMKVAYPFLATSSHRLKYTSAPPMNTLNSIGLPGMLAPMNQALAFAP